MYARIVKMSFTRADQSGRWSRDGAKWRFRFLQRWRERPGWCDRNTNTTRYEISTKISTPYDPNSPKSLQVQTIPK
ncbi:hypothetical protein VN97_g8663 [Penicillium thymicola]|uniref:Uncharacterized protein n=1 Tax=Penicillium thymicola TaxID=293382 RepID=A0AAI9TCZ9_PENTH|nr:hypothetical protein VN97_g8663 [Penicillium thymicola]